MRSRAQDPFRDPCLDQVLQTQIQERTGGYLRSVRVEVTPKRRVIVRGGIATYYLKQLALAAVLEVLGSDDPELVELHITASDGTG